MESYRAKHNRGDESPSPLPYSTVLVLSHVWHFATPWTVTSQAPPSVGFSRQEYWSGLPCPPPGDLPDSRVELASVSYIDWQVGSLLLAPPGKPYSIGQKQIMGLTHVQEERITQVGSLRLILGCVHKSLGFKFNSPHLSFLFIPKHYQLSFHLHFHIHTKHFRTGSIKF